MAAPPAKKKRALQKFKLEYTRTWPILIESTKKGVFLRAATCATLTSQYRTVVAMISGESVSLSVAVTGSIPW